MGGVKHVKNQIIGIEEFSAITEPMNTAEAERIRTGLLYVLDKGEVV